MDPVEQADHRTVAELLLAVREHRSLTQQELARLSGLERSQLNRYEKGRQEPSLVTLRRVLGTLGWALVLKVEPATARLDEALDRAPDVLRLLGLEVPRVLEIAALAHENGAGLAVAGEVAAVLQGVPVCTTDIQILVRPHDVGLVVKAAATFHHGVTDCFDDSGDLVLFVGEVRARLVESQVLPASRLVKVDFESWFSGRPVPVVDLAVLCESGALGAGAAALVRRMAHRSGTESIPESVL